MKEPRRRVFSVRVPVVCSFAFVLIAPLALAQESPQRVHQVDNLRVFYHTDGMHAVNVADKNRNGIPDQVEDVLTQTLAARAVFVEVLGFRDPFRTERFRSAKYLDIHLRHKDVLKSNGVAYDELQRFQKPGDPAGTLSICFNVAISVSAPTNLTPAHEFFHLIQNSTTFFKNRWFTEGTARWSELALGTGEVGRARPLDAWPLPVERAATLSTMAYEASEHFWNPLAAKFDRQSAIPEGPALERLRAMTYTDGSPVLKDARLTGWKFFRSVLGELDQMDDVAFRELGYERWSEENQKSPKNDRFILEAVGRVVNRMQRGPAATPESSSKKAGGGL